MATRWTRHALFLRPRISRRAPEHRRTMTNDSSVHNRLGCHGPFQCKDCGASPRPGAGAKALRRSQPWTSGSNNQPGLPDPALPRSLAVDIPVAGLKRDKEVLKRQLSLSQKQYMSCRHCNESEKDEAKANRQAGRAASSRARRTTRAPRCTRRSRGTRAWREAA